MNLNLIEQQGTSETEEQRLILYGVTWQQYENLRATLDDFPGLRMFYLEGTLEIISPSPEHEVNKTSIARLIEIYALEKDIELTGYGSTTFRKQAQERGLEPDECYCFGQLKEVPDIALEVIFSSGGINKLSIYQGLAVPEVWFWQNKQFSIYRLQNEGYETRERSDFLPYLDFFVLAQFIKMPSQTKAVKAYRDTLNN